MPLACSSSYDIFELFVASERTHQCLLSLALVVRQKLSRNSCSRGTSWQFYRVEQKKPKLSRCVRSVTKHPTESVAFAFLCSPWFVNSCAVRCHELLIPWPGTSFAILCSNFKATFKLTMSVAGQKWGLRVSRYTHTHTHIVRPMKCCFT